MRKIIQIAACGVQENGQTQCDAYFTALCDDGSVWITDNRRGSDWHSLPAIPQYSLADGYVASAQQNDDK